MKWWASFFCFYFVHDLSEAIKNWSSLARADPSDLSDNRSVCHPTKPCIESDENGWSFTSNGYRRFWLFWPESDRNRPMLSPSIKSSLAHDQHNNHFQPIFQSLTHYHFTNFGVLNFTLCRGQTIGNRISFLITVVSHIHSHALF
jgi:hypothetical protein